MKSFTGELSLTGLFICAIAITGCGGGGGGATPEAVFEKAKAATAKEDWKTVVQCMTAENRDALAGRLAFGGMMMKQFAGIGGPDGAKEMQPVADVLEKHGLTDEVLKAMDPKVPPTDEEAIFKTMIEPVKDKEAFTAEMMGAMSKTKGVANRNPLSGDATLKDVKIDGDSATGTIETTIDGKKEPSPIGFKKVDGGWKIQFDLPKMGK